MKLREGTMLRYMEFIAHLKAQPGSFNLIEAISDKKVDMRFLTFLKRNEYVIEVVGNPVLVNRMLKMTETTTAQIVNDFNTYREKTEADSKEKRKKLEQSISIEKANELITIAEERTKINVANECAKYAQMAVDLGKKDIAGFILTLLNTK